MFRGGNKKAGMAGLVVLACLFAVSPAWATSSPVPQVACKAISVPKGTKVTIVATRIVINNLPMSIVAARNAASPETFAAYYKNKWKGSGKHPLYVENTVGPWNVIGHKDGKCMYTVQIRQDKSYAYALIGVGTPGNGAHVRNAMNFPAPGDAKPLTHMVSEDGGTLGDTWMLYTANSVSATTRYYTSVLPQYGWRPLLTDSDSNTRSRKLLMFQNGSRNAGITVQPFRNGSVITLTVMQR
jgi:hypothetical protein